MKSERGMGFFALIFSILVISIFVVFSIYLIKLDNIVREKFEGQRWDIPAKVFARPMEVYVNAPVSQQDFQQELKLLGYKNSDSYAKSGNFVTTGNTLYVHTRGFDFGDRVEPEQVLKVSFSASQVTEVSATKPSSSGIARLEPLLIGGIYPQHNEDRVLIKLNKVPKPLIEALIATEDRKFYEHHGVSPRGIARAVVSNITGGKRQGGSTLTQQLVKNFYLTPERTLKRKVNEAFMAMLVELHYDKNEILEAYLNEVNLGQNGNYSINGYGLASQFYFGLPLRELNISQQAFLVGLVQGPSLYNPWRNPESAKKRRDIVLNNMLVMGYLSQEQYEKETARPLNVISKPTLGPARFPDFLDIVRRQLRTDYQETDLTNQGLRIFTTLDPLAQTRIQDSFKQTVARLTKSNPGRLKDLQGAVLVSHPENGELVAAVGSTQDFTGFNRTVDAKRQVGSLLKPVIYLSALESNRYHWASPIEDSEISVQSDGKTWTPKNYSGRGHGVVPMSQALSQSYNLSTVRLGQEFGLSTFINHLKKFGVTSDIPSYPSIYLGAVDMSPMEVMNIYGNFATGGFKYPTKSIRSVVDANGRILDRYSLSVQPTIDPASAYALNYGLQQVMSSGTGRAAYNSLPSNLNLAGKSGTTNDSRDSWFAGYSGNYMTVVWLGLDDNKVTGLTGSSGALPVWVNVMKQLRQKPVNLPQPNEIQWHWLDRYTGLLSAPGCEGAMYIPISQHSLPNQATPCGLSRYVTEPVTIDSEPSSSNPDEMDDISRYIQESETEIERDLANETRIISSGSYSH
ncbi:penicillin-binding protein 1B [Acinetobacter sp. YH12106]|uniref:penicillin-binding protein 1B n=1 Tax=Acinetobacter sp. YH12106 TaxID=2601094 RepID=UPI0015D21096|nr:penicillin-binding protein 1B [Acinetobacter sp. YH12106]